MFPWVCMSTDEKCSFSDVIAKCYSSATKYMSVKEEKDFTQAALKIAFSVKIKRLKMNMGKPDLIGGSGRSVNKIFKSKLDTQGASTIGDIKFDSKNVSNNVSTFQLSRNELGSQLKSTENYNLLKEADSLNNLDISKIMATNSNKNNKSSFNDEYGLNTIKNDGDDQQKGLDDDTLNNEQINTNHVQTERKRPFAITYRSC